MAYFLVRVLVNALAVALTFLFTPGIRIESAAESQLGLIVIYILLGILFGLINAFVRPLVLLLTGNLLIWSMGLLVLVINGSMFYLLSIVIPGIVIVDSPVLLRVVIAAAILAIIAMVLEAVFGLDSPVLDDPGKSKFYWRWLGRLPTGRRNRIVENLRLSQVYRTVRSYGLDILVALTPLAKFRKTMQGWIYPDKQVLIEANVPESVRLMLQELGPTYVKLGQMLAGRSDILPEEWTAELSKLQSTVAPFAYPEVQRIIKEELGAPPEELFLEFNPDPIAAASMAQVHRAKLPGGEDIAVKVQRPDIDVTVKGDLNVMRDVVHTLERRVKWARHLGLSGVIDEFADNVAEELDFRNDSYNTHRITQNMSDYDFVHIPAVFEQYSTQRVLTMEYVRGVKITDTESLDGARVDRTILAEKFLRVMNKQVLIDGFFHADPHPGNVLYDLDHDRIVFLDLGMIGYLGTEKRMALFDVIWSLKNGDAQNLTNRLLQLSRKTRDIDRVNLGRDIERLIGKYILYADKSPVLSEVIQETLDIVFRYGLVLDRALTLAMKSMMQSEENVRILDPELSFIDVAVDAVQNAVLDQFSSDNAYENIKQQAFRTAKDIVVNAPRWQKSAAKWAEQLENGRLSIDLNAGKLGDQLDRVERSLNQSARRIVFGLLLVGLLLSVAIISTINFDDLSVNYITLDLFIFIFLAVVLVGVIYLLWILWHAWRDRLQ
jgi:ubiquinone biosynthesis protein